MNTCENCRYYMASQLQEPCESCRWDGVVVGHDPSNFSAPTNADSIRAMSDEELAEYLATKTCAPSCVGQCHDDYDLCCDDCWLDWLRREAHLEQAN